MPSPDGFLFVLIDFVTLTYHFREYSMEIPPAYNSFRRLLFYRIGDRFGLDHSTSNKIGGVSLINSEVQFPPFLISLNSWMF